MNEWCPTCRVDWGDFPPKRLEHTEAYRCIECKAVYTQEMRAAPELLSVLKANTRNLWELERVTRQGGDDKFADILMVNAMGNDRTIAKAEGRALAASDREEPNNG